MPFFHDAATSSQDPALRPAGMINLATPYAVRVVESLGVAEQSAAGVREVAYPVVHDRDLWEVLDIEAHRRFIDELTPVQSAMSSPQVAELYDGSAVTDGGLAPTRVIRDQQALTPLGYACAC